MTSFGAPRTLPGGERAQSERCDDETVAGALPLNVLLARALLSLTRAYEAHDDVPPLPMLLLGLRIVDPVDGVDPKEAPALARASKRAMKVLLKGDGYEERGKRLHLTPAGRDARVRGMAALEAAEAGWTKRVGKARATALRNALAVLVDRFDLELPHYWITYAGVDPRVTGGNFRPAKPGPPRIPARGQDWTPVLRATDGPTTTADLGLVALLSQALVGFAIEYEAHAGALTDAILTLPPFAGDGGVPFAESPAFSALTGDGRSRLERHGMVIVVDGDDDRVAKLTDIGRWLVAAYEPTTAKVEAQWCDELGADLVTRLRTALEAVAPELEPDLADHPFLVWSLRDGIREVAHG